jgi:hypothetical protein
MKEYRQTDKYKKIQKEHNLLEKRREYLKDYLKKRNQSDKHKKKLKEYRLSDKGKKAFNKYFKERRKLDPIFKLAGTLRTRLKTFLTRSTAQIYNLEKTNETFKMVGCTPEFLKEYLEKQFTSGMTWQNHGVHGWHIDHIKPLDLAKTQEDIEQLMHYTNLQPMWATDNLKKSNKIN